MAVNRISVQHMMKNQLIKWYLDDIQRLSREGFVNDVMSTVAELVELQTTSQSYKEMEQKYREYLENQNGFSELTYEMMIQTFVAHG